MQTPTSFYSQLRKSKNEVLSYLKAKGLDTSFKGRISNDDETFNEEGLRKIAENLCQAALENTEIPVIIDDTLSYNYEYLTAWMIPNFCEYKGIDMNAENWTEQLKDYTVCTLDEVFAFLCDDDENDKNGIAFNIGTEDALLIPHATLKEAWHKLAGEPEPAE